MATPIRELSGDRPRRRTALEAMDPPITEPSDGRRRKTPRRAAPEAMAPPIIEPSGGRTRRAPRRTALEAMDPPITESSGDRRRKTPRRRTMPQEPLPIPRNYICDDIVSEILSLLPVRSAFKLQAVSKSWRSVIQTRLLPRWLPNTILGFFYHPHGFYYKGEALGYPRDRPWFRGTGRIGGHYLSRGGTPQFFLRQRPFRIVGCCNDLLLCWRFYDRGTLHQRDFFVCNPVTERMQHIPSPGQSSQMLDAYLAFDPHICPHFKVLFVVGSSASTNSETQIFCIYSSETGSLGQTKMLGHIHDLHIRGRQQCAFCDGALYVATGSINIIRFNLQEETCRVIKLPAASKEPSEKASLGRLGGRVCYADLRGLRLRVWMLEGCHDEWSCKHSLRIKGIKELCPQGGVKRFCAHILAFHPHSEAIFFLVKGRVIAFDLEKNAFDYICNLEPENYQGKLHLSDATAFPFSSCLLDTLDIQRKKDKEKLPASIALN